MDILSNSHVWCAHMKWKDHINPLNFLNSHTRNINVKPFNRRAMGKTNNKLKRKDTFSLRIYDMVYILCWTDTINQFRTSVKINVKYYEL